MSFSQIKEIGGLKADQGGANVKKNIRSTEDCRRGFKIKAINHKINSCQTYIRHFDRFSILAKVFKKRISSFACSPLKASGSC